MPRVPALDRLAHRAVATIRTAAAVIIRAPAWAELGRMDDRMLRDIGLVRRDVCGLAAEPLFRDDPRGLSMPDGRDRPARAAAALGRSARAALRRLWADESRTVSW